MLIINFKCFLYAGRIIFFDDLCFKTYYSIYLHTASRGGYGLSISLRVANASSYGSRNILR